MMKNKNFNVKVDEMSEQYCYDGQFASLESAIYEVRNEVQELHATLKEILNHMKDVQIIMEEKTGIDTKKIYRPSVKRQED